MAIKDFEFYHGAVLTKILRKDIPLTLTLIETNTSESWSTYKIANNYKDAIIYMKYCASPRITSKHTAWTFNFNKEHLKEITKYIDNDLYLALIGAQKNINNKPMEICLLKKEEILESIDINSNIPQTFTVFCEPNKKLRVRGTLINHNELKVERNRLDKLGNDW